MKRRVKPARNRLFAGVVLILTFLGGAAFAETEREKDSFLAGHFSVGAKVRRLLDSYTSYEFGNPFPPYQALLSRLESHHRINIPTFTHAIQ